MIPATDAVTIDFADLFDADRQLLAWPSARLREGNALSCEQLVTAAQILQMNDRPIVIC